jgi:molecular chaperone DnaJ
MYIFQRFHTEHDSKSVIDFDFCSGPLGDLYVYLDVEEITGIQRDGINLTSTISISYADAILGTVVKVIFLSSQLDLCMP